MTIARRPSPFGELLSLRRRWIGFSRTASSVARSARAFDGTNAAPARRDDHD